MFNKNIKVLMVSLAVLATLTACQGKDADADSGAKSSSPPIVIIDSTKQIYADQKLELFAEATDDGEIDSYLWNAKEGNKVVGNKAILTINPPHKVGHHNYAISVTDDDQQITTKEIEVTVIDSKYRETSYDVTKYVADKSPAAYELEQIDDNSFNTLSIEDKYKVAEKILSSLFFSYDHNELTARIESGSFISDIQNQFLVSSNDMEAINAKIFDEDIYYQNDYNSSPTMLTRLYEMKDLDKTYLDHWISYILSQTILFSPALELPTVAQPDGYGVYDRLHDFQSTGAGMRYTTFIHMRSNENWRRFRSPEDNGREMMEIYLLDGNDAHVPLAAQALKNWHLSRGIDSTLVIESDKNTEILTINDMTFKTGVEFYASLVNSKAFSKGITTRLVNFMFTSADRAKKAAVINKIVSSQPETWKDILAQIIFSKDYLLNTSRVKSIEEVAFPLMRKLHFNTYSHTFYSMNVYMNAMSQSSMSYKLGKLTRVPMDDISFASYQKYLRFVLMRARSIDSQTLINPRGPIKKEGVIQTSEMIMNDYSSGYRRGVSFKNFTSKFEVVEGDKEQTFSNQVNYLFNSLLHRDPTAAEMAMFVLHMNNSSYKGWVNYENNNDNEFQQFIRDYYGKTLVNYMVFEYILRLDEIYFYQQPKK